MGSKLNVLFLWTGNSCRSQMAEGFVREFGGDRFSVVSAGAETAARVHPLAIQVMEEKWIDIRGQEPKSVAQSLGRLAVGYLIIVCTEAEYKCRRVFPGMMHRLFWPFVNPAKFEGSPSATLEGLRAARGEIEARIKQWLEEKT
jgi:arsenate reductase